MVLTSLIDVAASRFAEAAANRTLDEAFAERKRRRWKVPRLGDVVSDETIRQALDGHLLRASKWAANVHIFRMPEPASTAATTLALDLTKVARKFRARGHDLGSGDPDRLLRESDLLADDRDYVLLGDPGAGKTTTIKRLVGRLLASPEPPADEWTTPIVVLLREHSRESSVSRMVLEVLGLSEPIDGLLEPLRERLQENDDEVELEYRLAEHRLVAAVLDSLGAVLFLDGMDEVPIERRKSLDESVVRLTQHLRRSKVIASCRSGDFDFLDGFSTAEICSLTSDQTTRIAALWLSADPSAFQAELERRGAVELANRPLFLCLLLAVYKNHRRIPDQQSILSRQMVRVVLQEWDEKRQLVRGSKYKEFDTESKLEFLSNLAYFVTFELRRKHFEHRQLVKAYRNLYERFKLPSNEADLVAREIETHTGIIVEVGSGGYEFSHLLIQEYLAAEWIVRLPDVSLVPELYDSNPPVLAVAVGLSSDPGRYLSIVAPVALRVSSDRLLKSFLTRLVQERPSFGPSAGLGVAVLRLIAALGPSDQPTVEEVVYLNGVAESIRKVTRGLYVATKHDDSVTLTMHRAQDSMTRDLPRQVRLSADIARHLGEGR